VPHHGGVVGSKGMTKVYVPIKPFVIASREAAWQSILIFHQMNMLKGFGNLKILYIELKLK